MPIKESLLGSGPATQAIVDRFYQLVLEDQELRPYFDGVDVPRVKRHQVALLTQLLNGPQEYRGRDLVAAHRGLGITEGHYRTVANLLVGVLRSSGVPADVVTMVGMTLATVQPQVVEAGA